MLATAANAISLNENDVIRVRMITRKNTKNAKPSMSAWSKEKDEPRALLQSAGKIRSLSSTKRQINTTTTAIDFARAAWLGNSKLKSVTAPQRKNAVVKRPIA